MTAIAEVLPVSSQTDLVRSAAKGDALGFERLLASRADGAFRVARAMQGTESDARDATQDAFVSAWGELPRLRDPERFDPWLRRILVKPLPVAGPSGYRARSADRSRSPRGGVWVNQPFRP